MSASKTGYYSELNCISNFSFLRGASHPEELVRQAAQLGYKAIAITDECSLSGVVRAHCEAKIHDIELIIGSEFIIENLHFILLAPNRLGYSELSRLITQGRRRSDKGRYHLTLDDLHKCSQHLLIIWLPFTDINEYTIHDHLKTAIPENKVSPDQKKYLKTLIKRCKERFWLGISLLQNRISDQQHLDDIRKLQHHYQRPVVACGRVHMHIPERQPLQDTLTAIRLGCTVQEAGYSLQSNRERYLRPIPILQAIYPSSWLTETDNIRSRCDFSLSSLRYEYPQELVPHHLTAIEHLRVLVKSGIQRRWPKGASANTLTLIEKELALIEELSYEYYFLTVHDIVQFARSKKILCQGRGSAANSAVCFCLGITEVDPEKIDVLFERFISKERNEPPDIDIDFEHDRREEVIQFIYHKYGRQRAALTATVITYRRKSAIRDLGKALGFDPSLIEHMLKSLSKWEKDQTLESYLEKTQLSLNAPLIKHFYHLFKILLGFPRHLSQHVGGFVISKGALHELVPIENAAMPDRTIIQWDKDDIEALGLLKIDILALGMLSAIHKAFDLIEHYRGEKWHMSTLPQEDYQVYKMLQRGDSIGVFQVESRAQMSMLPRLKPCTFYDLVIEVAIVRPGPIQGNMVHPYLKRRNGEEEINYPNEGIKRVLKRTLGIPIFQEQVIKLAMVAADFSAGEADQLRRSMASWRRKGELQRYQEKLISGMRENGYSAEFAHNIIQQINGFAEYGFPESHAASFALLVYVSAWLKCHEPAAFFCALLNSQPMGFYSPSQLIQDAHKHQVVILPIDILFSEWDHSLTGINATTISKHNPPIRLGFRLIKGLSHTGAVRLIQARDRLLGNRSGTISSAQQLSNRNKDTRLQLLHKIINEANLCSSDLESLTAADVFRSLSGNRYQSHWSTLGFNKESQLLQEETAPYRKKNHPSDKKEPDLPLDYPREKSINFDSPSIETDVIEDYRTTGLSLRAHPLALLRPRHREIHRCKRSSDLIQLSNARFVKIAGLVTGRQRPSTASGIIFLTIEDECGNCNIIVRPTIADRYRNAVMHGRLVMIKGTIEKSESVTHVLAGEILDYSELIDKIFNSDRGDAYFRSRDFH